MNSGKKGSRFWRLFKALLLVALVSIAIREVYIALAPDPEIALILGEPWEDMRARSTAAIDPAIPGHVWGRIPKSDARLNFIDPQFGFVTPKARFFSITFDNERATSLRISPLVEPLLLDDALKVVIDIQDQWRAGGWTVFPNKPAFIDTPEWRKELREIPNGKTTFWQAGDKFQALMAIHRFKDKRHPDQERFMIILNVARPWIPPPKSLSLPSSRTAAP